MSTTTKSRTRTSHTPVVCRQIAAAFTRGESLQNLGRRYTMSEKDLAKLIYDTLNQDAHPEQHATDRVLIPPAASDVVDVIDVDAHGLLSLLLVDGRVWITRAWKGPAATQGAKSPKRRGKSKRTQVLVFRRPDLVYETHLGDGSVHLSALPLLETEITRLRHDLCAPRRRSITNLVLRHSTLALMEQERIPDLAEKSHISLKSISEAIGSNDSGLRRALGITAASPSIKTNKQGQVRSYGGHGRPSQVIEVGLAARLAHYLLIDPTELGL